MLNAATRSSPQRIRFINQQRRVVGFGLTGTPQDDVAKIVDSDAGLSGLRGYMQASATGAQVTAIGDEPPCQLDVYVPSQLIK